jgi:hypothetical protein
MVAMSTATYTVSVTAFSFTPKLLTVTSEDTVTGTSAGGSQPGSLKTGVSELSCSRAAVF